MEILLPNKPFKRNLKIEIIVDNRFSSIEFDINTTNHFCEDENLFYLKIDYESGSAQTV